MKMLFDRALFRARFLGRRFPMICAQVRHLLPGYLDGALPESLGPKGHALVGKHLEGCLECRQELERYLDLSMTMSSVGLTSPPADLGVTIRNAVSRARAGQGMVGQMRRWKNRLEVVIENILEPLALPAAGGVVVALLVFAMVYQVLGAGMPLGGASHDSPTNLLQPARLEILAGFQMSKLDEMTRAGGQNPLMVEAMVNAQGEAVSYRVISGQVDATAQHELDQVVFFSRFRPQLSFGRPTSRGRVVLSFSQILVRG